MDMKKRRDMQLAYISDEAVMEEQRIGRKILQKLNFADRSDFDGIAEIVKELLGKSEGAWINPPFYCDYGSHIEVGKNFFANYNCTIIDVAKVKIGDNCQMAPNVSIYTAGHPIYPDTRNSAFEYGKEVTIGDNVWLGGNTVVCPGVHIGDNVVIGAGSVVTKDIPDWSIAAGNPCRVIRKITDEDRRKLFHNEEIDDEEKQEAIHTMVSMTDLSEKEAAAELLLEAKGFKNVVVNLTGETADVVIPEAELSDAQRAQIEDIVKRKTGIAPENIVITPLKESEDAEDTTQTDETSADTSYEEDSETSAQPYEDTAIDTTDIYD